MEILLADDNTDYLNLMKEALEMQGYNVQTAEDGMEGCEILASTDIDLIISDVRMPRFDGIKLHAFARRQERYKRTKFIFISGYQDLDNSVLDKEIDFFFDKMTPPEVIIKFVDQQMSGSHARNRV